MKALLSQIRFMIKDAWKSRGRRSHVDWSQATALRHTTRPASGATCPAFSTRRGACELTAEANERYLDSFEKTS